MYRGQSRQETQESAPRKAAAVAPARTVTTYRVAMLTLASGPILCLVRTLSGRIATLDIDMPFAPQDNATLEIGRERLTGALVRTGEHRAELRTDDEIDIDVILGDPSLLASAGRRALPRVEVDARARIDIGAHRIPAQVRDISTDGIKIYTDELLSIGDEVRIVLKGLERPLPGTVRWCSGDHAGIEFVQRLPISRLNAWLASQAAGEDEAPWSPPIVSKS
ncbi:MAG: PilZ domain-containing protein [Sphingomonadaceae bacterium]|nr:PilZ domain-containing protein [Sphingomonadaceae bacterium]